MNTPPLRFKDSADTDEFLRALLNAGQPTSPLPHSARLRGERRVGKLAAAPAVVIGIGLWSKVVAAAFGVGFASALALVSVSPALRERVIPKPAVAGKIPERKPSAAALSPAATPSSDTRREAPLANTSSLQETPPRPSRSSPPAVKPPATTAAVPTATPSAPLALAGLDAPSTSLEPVAPRSAPVTDSMSAEVRLLTRSRGLLSSDPNQALDLLNRHAVEFPNPALAMEREMLVIEALQHTGRAKQAKERARELLAGSPGAFYAARLERLIQGP